MTLSGGHISEELPEWKQFEDEVAYYYRTLGYEVKQNNSLKGHQIDIIASKEIPGGVKLTIQVECKCYSGPIGINELTNHVNAFKDVRFDLDISKLIVVANKGFTKDSMNNAVQNNITLKTFDELRMEVIDTKSYISRIIYDYEHFDEYSHGQRNPIFEIMGRSDLCSYYVNLRCRDSKGKIFDPIENYIEDWLKNSDVNHLILLGDYGTGKSSFLITLAYEIAKSHKDDPINFPLPIFISLKDHKEIHNIRKTILDICEHQYGLTFSNQMCFDRLLEDGKLIVLLDGFDEMETKSEKDTILRNFKEINKMVAGKSKVILTSRTHYFKTDSDVTNIFNPQFDTELLASIRGHANFAIMELLEFNDDQILDFLKKHFGEDYWSHWIDIKSTYNLQDLSRRPILLDMIISTLPDLIRSGLPINSSRLYEKYTAYWIERDGWRSIIGSFEKEALMEELAIFMTVGKTYQVHYEKLAELVRSHFKKKDISREYQDELETEIRTCSFLNRDKEGNYRFIHKSFMEYFIAQRIVKEIRLCKPDLLIKMMLSPEIIDFTGKLLTNREEVYKLILLTAGKTFEEVGYLGGNSITLLNKMGEVAFSNKQFMNTVLRGADFGDTVCDGTSFSQADLRDANFTNASLIYTDFTGADLSNARFGGVGYVTALDTDEREKRVVFGTSSGFVIVYDAQTYRRTQIKQGGEPIVQVKFFAKDQMIGSVDAASAVNVWSMDYSQISSFTPQVNNSKSIDFDPALPIVSYPATNPSELAFYDVTKEKTTVIHMRPPIQHGLKIIKFIDDGRKMLLVDKTDKLHIANLAKESVEEIRHNGKSIDWLDYDDEAKIIQLISSGPFSLLELPKDDIEGDPPRKVLITKDITRSVETIRSDDWSSSSHSISPLGRLSGDCAYLIQANPDTKNEFSNDYKFSIIDVKTGKILKEAYNTMLKYAGTFDASWGGWPIIRFGKKGNAAYISDFNGNLIMWNWQKEDDLKSKSKGQYGRDTMLQSKILNYNIFKSGGQLKRNEELVVKLFEKEDGE